MAGIKGVMIVDCMSSKLAEVKKKRDQMPNDDISYIILCEESRFSEKFDILFMAR